MSDKSYLTPVVLRLWKSELFFLHPGQKSPSFPLQSHQSSIFQHLFHWNPLLFNALLHFLFYAQNKAKMWACGDYTNLITIQYKHKYVTWAVSIWFLLSTLLMAFCNKQSAPRRSVINETSLWNETCSTVLNWEAFWKRQHRVEAKGDKLSLFF